MADGGKVVIRVDADDKDFKNASKTWGKIGGTALKGIAVGAGAVTGAIGKIGFEAIKAYSNYEQLVGGVETLFGTRGAKTLEEYATIVGKTAESVSAEYEMLQEAQTRALSNASQAYQSAGLSANAYMETATSLAAALNQSSASQLESADLADMAIRDMSDNANKMGTSMEMIQNAYNGFSKANFTMLDNLKLGFGGTKTEMERLLVEAGKISGIKYDISSFSDIVSAIHIIQEEMGITGTTANEASTTIQGSFSMLQASWENLMIGMSDPSQNVDELLNNVVESMTIFAENLLPRIEEILPQIAESITTLAPLLIETIMNLIPELLPAVVDGVASIAQTIVNEIPNVLPQLLEAGKQIIDGIIQGANENFPALTTTVEAIAGIFAAIKIGSTIQSITKGFQEAQLALKLFELQSNGTSIATAAMNGTLRASEVIVALLTGKMTLAELAQKAMAVAQGALNAVMSANPIGLVVTAIGLLVTAFVLLWNKSEAFRNFWIGLWDKIKEVVGIAVNWVKENWKLIIGFILNPIGTAIAMLYQKNEAFREWVDSVIAKIKATFAKIVEVGKNIITGLWNGINNAKDWLINKITSFCSNALGAIKKFFGIKSPSTVMRDQVGKFVALGFAVGIDRNSKAVISSAKAMGEKTIEAVKSSITDNRSEVQKVMDSFNETLLESEKKYNEESERLKDSKEETDKAYLESLKETAEKERKIYDAQLKDIENYKKSVVDAYTDLANEAFGKIEEVQKLQEDFAGKLNDSINLYEEVEDKQGNKKFKLADIGEQTEALKLYAENLQKLKNRGNVPKEFFNIIRDMSVEEGTNFVNALLQANDEKFDTYIEQWKEQQAVADVISKELYAEETEEALKEVGKEFEDFNKDLDTLGVNNGDSWASAFASEVRSQLRQLKDEISMSFGSLMSTSSLGLAMAGGGTSNTYNTYNDLGTIKVESALQLDGRTLGRTTFDVLKQEMTRRGVTTIR